MKHLTIQKILIFIIALTATPIGIYAQQDSIEYQSTVDKTEILIGDQVNLSLKLVAPKSVGIAFPQFKEYIIEGVEVVRELPADTIQGHDNTFTLHKNYVLTSFDSGTYVLPPIPVLVLRGPGQADTLYSPQSYMLTVNTFAIDTATYKIHDIKQPIASRLTLQDVLPFVLGALVFIILLVVAFFLLRKNNILFNPAKPKDAPDVAALKELYKLKTEKLWQQGKVKQFYTRLSDILRVYLDERFTMSTMEHTSAEIMDILRQSDLFTEEQLAKLNNMLSTSDLVKFAKYQPMNDENDRYHEIVREFIESTRPKTEEEDKATTDKTTTSTAEK